MKSNQPSDFRTVRGYQLANRKEGQLSSSLEDYLEMVYRLCLEDEYTRVGKLSELLHVRPSSASKMIAKLVRQGYLHSDRYETIRLTDRGMREGEYLLARHETVERFLQLIGSDDSLKEAELIEHSLSPLTISNLQILLSFFHENKDFSTCYQAFRLSR